jgi:3-oxoacyl-[acyl-carrier protein] reductase
MTSEPAGAARRKALVTGGARGLGSAFVEELARAGMDVAFTYFESEAACRARLSELQGLGLRCSAFPLDVRDAEAAQQLVSLIEGAGGVDVLVNNAGVSRDGVAWKLPPETFRDTLDINLTGAFNLIRAALPGMRRRRWGRILNVSSVVAETGIAGTSAYASSKAGLFGLTRAVAREVAGQGITVNCLALGYFDAGMGGALPPELRERIVAQIPMARFGDPAKLARIVAFLASDDCDYVTGQVLTVDGGFLG